MSQLEPSTRPVTKAVIPAAGLGTRFLPATKATPKEMLPVVDKPAIQYVVEEAVAAGLEDLLFITGRSKRSLEDHFDRNSELEEALAAKGDTTKLDLVRWPTSLGRIHYVRQGEPLGLGHAVLQARQHVGNEPFAVLLGDDLIDESNPILPRMLDVQRELGGSVVCLMGVPPSEISLYGCAAVHASEIPGVLGINDLVEKPSADVAPSNFAIIGRYVLAPEIFDVLDRTEPGIGGEIQLTDALRVLAGEGAVHGVVFDGLRYDTGDRLSYLKAVVSLAVRRDDLGPALRDWLREQVAEDFSRLA